MPFDQVPPRGKISGDERWTDVSHDVSPGDTGSKDADVPGCDAGPARRLAFVLAEIQAAVRRRKSNRADRSKKGRN